MTHHTLSLIVGLRVPGSLALQELELEVAINAEWARVIIPTQEAWAH